MWKPVASCSKSLHERCRETGTVTSYGMDESRLDTMLCAAHMRLNASWKAFVRSETDVTRKRYRHEIGRMNRLLVARQAPGIAFRTATDQSSTPQIMLRVICENHAVVDGPLQH
jgi:hypothetical protein